MDKMLAEQKKEHSEIKKLLAKNEKKLVLLKDLRDKCLIIMVKENVVDDNFIRGFKELYLEVMGEECVLKDA